MAHRSLAAAEDVLALVPTKDDAVFMQEKSAQMVGLQAATMRLAVAPETAPQVLDMLDARNFRWSTPRASPVWAPTAKPTYAPDRKPFIDAVVGREIQGVHAR